MTHQSDFKQRVRARMQKTGEAYTTARAQLLERGGNDREAPIPGLLAGYPAFGGDEGDLAALTHVLEHAGVRGPAGAPLSEAMVFGLMGGPGFMYFVFEYSGLAPMLTVILRSFSLPDPLVAQALERLGVGTTIVETGSAKRARAALDEAHAAGRAALCSIDRVTQNARFLPKAWRGQSPQLAAVVGLDDDAVWLDDRAVRPVRVPQPLFAESRAARSKAKHRLVTVDNPALGRPLVEAVRQAVRGTIATYTEAPFKGFGNNFGLAGLEKWADLLVDSKSQKGWPQLLATGEARARALMRVDEGLRRDYAPPFGGRALYADFLDEAAELLGATWPHETAARFRASGALFERMSERIRATPDETVQRLIDLTDELALGLRVRQEDTEDSSQPAPLWREREALAGGAMGDGSGDPRLFEELAAMVRSVLELERAAVTEMGHALGGP